MKLIWQSNLGDIFDRYEANNFLEPYRSRDIPQNKEGFHKLFILDKENRVYEEVYLLMDFLRNLFLKETNVLTLSKMVLIRSATDDRCSEWKFFYSASQASDELGITKGSIRRPKEYIVCRTNGHNNQLRWKMMTADPNCIHCQKRLNPLD